MNNPESYVKYHRLQYRDNMRCMAENMGRIRWRGTERKCDDMNTRKNKPDVCNRHDPLGVSDGMEKLDVNNRQDALNVVNDQGVLEVSNGNATVDEVNGCGVFELTNGQDLLDLLNSREILDVNNRKVTLNVKNKGHIMDVGNIHSSQNMGALIRVLDVGSGDGRFTSNELRRAIPANCQLIGCDRSPSMVDYANTHHAGDGVKFELVEIGRPLPDHYIGAFDHIFSFFCYHWVPNQKLAFSQTYDMLTAGGDCLLLMVANFPIVFDVYRWFSRSSRWSRWINDLDDLISPYHDCEDPEMKLRRYAEEAGFKDIYVKNTKLSYTYDSVQDIKDMMTSLNPFRIPEELMAEYLEEYIRVSKAEGYLSETLSINYSTNTLYARKY